MDRWIDKWMDQWMDGWMDRQMDTQNLPILQDFVPCPGRCPAILRDLTTFDGLKGVVALFTHIKDCLAKAVFYAVPNQVVT